MTTQRKMSEILLERYEYLAKKYASKIFGYEQLSLEYEDLIQEFRIKLITSIKAYGRAWKKYRDGENPRPMPIKAYLECACGNKVRDFIKYISRENYKVRMDDINYDYGVESDTDISPIGNKFIVNGIDLLEGLVGKEKMVFSLFLRGYPRTFLTKVYCNNKSDKARRQEVINNGDEPLKVTDVIELQKEFLITKYGNELQTARRMFASYSVED